MAFVDYKKAFDTADREKLWDVHQKLQTPFKMIMILKAMYNSGQVVSQVGWKPSYHSFSNAHKG